MNFDEIWNDDGALSSCSRDDAEDFYNEGAKCQQSKINLLEKELTETQAFLNKQNHIKQTKIDCMKVELDGANERAMMMFNHKNAMVDKMQAKIDELQARVDEALYAADESCGVSVAAFVKLNRILKGNKDEN